MVRLPCRPHVRLCLRFPIPLPDLPVWIWRRRPLLGLRLRRRPMTKRVTMRHLHLRLLELSPLLLNKGSMEWEALRRCPNGRCPRLHRKTHLPCPLDSPASLLLLLFSLLLLPTVRVKHTMDKTSLPSRKFHLRSQLDDRDSLDRLLLRLPALRPLSWPRLDASAPTSLRVPLDRAALPSVLPCR